MVPSFARHSPLLLTTCSRYCNAFNAATQRHWRCFTNNVSTVLYALALRVVRIEADAEDVLSEVFLQVWRTPVPIRRNVAA